MKVQLLEWRALGLSVFCVIALAACGDRAPTTAAQFNAPTPTAPLTITLWHTETGASAEALNALAKDFHQAYPAITIQGEQKGSDGDLLRLGLAGIAMNQVPDLVIASDRTIAEFARKGALVNLDVFVEDTSLGLRDEDRRDFIPGLLDAGRFPDLKNQRFAFPFDERAVVLYYNVDLLKAAKVDAPPRTWDQFSAAARSATKGNVHGWVMVPHAAVFYAFLFSRDGDVLNDAQTQAQFNDEAGLQSLQMIAALSKGGAAYLADSAESARVDLARGKAAFLFATTDDLTQISEALARANASFQWGVANVPQNDARQPVTAIFGAHSAIFRTTNDRARAAWLFARWLAEPVQSARWSRAALAIPVRTSARPLLAAELPPLFQRLRDSFGEALPMGRPLPSVKDAGQIDAAIVEMWTAVANGTDPAAALKNAAARVNRLLGLAP